MVANAYGVPVPVRFFENEEFRVNNIKKAVTKKTKAIIVNTPENPTGRIIKQPQLEEIGGIAEREDLFLISDEVYEKIIFGDSKHFSIAKMQPERTFVINSLSKTYAMPGWRIGWVLGKESFIKEMMKTSRSMVACPSSISQYAALEALMGSQDTVEDMRKEYERRRDLAVEKFAKMGLNFVSPEGTFYIFPQIKRDPWKFSLGLLKEKKVSVVPGDAFGSAGKDCVRLALTTSMDKIKDGLDKFEEYLD
jgi:aspartate/methionine/tyrosine aminotransferase